MQVKSAGSYVQKIAASYMCWLIRHDPTITELTCSKLLLRRRVADGNGWPRQVAAELPCPAGALCEMLWLCKKGGKASRGVMDSCRCGFPEN
jgi:hypothetical protein